MIDREKIKSKLEIIKEDIEELEKMKEVAIDQLKQNRREAAAAKFFIREAIEAMIDIAAHIVAKKLLGTPSTNVEIIEILSNKDMVSKENIATYIKMVKYRNRLVHFYQEVTIQEIYDIIQNKLGDFKNFIAEILNLLEKES